MPPMWMVTMLMTLGVLLLVAAASVKVVPKQNRALVERLGRIRAGVRKPGVVLLAPFVDRLILVPGGPMETELPARGDSSNGAPVRMELRATFDLADAGLAMTSLPGAVRDLAPRAQDFVANLMENEAKRLAAGHTSMELVTNREAINAELTQRVREAAHRVGLRLDRAEIAGIELFGRDREELEERARREKAD